MSSENKTISIYTEMTPNPQTMKFISNQELYLEKNIDFPEEGDAYPSPMAQELFAFPFIKGVFIAHNFVTLTKTQEATWEEITPFIRKFLKEYLASGKVIIDEDKIKEHYEDKNLSKDEDSDIIKKIKNILETYVKPAVAMDGGAIKYLDFKDGALKVELQGSCSGCPSSMITLKAGIEGIMKRMVPEVKEVMADMG